MISPAWKLYHSTQPDGRFGSPRLVLSDASHSNFTGAGPADGSDPAAEVRTIPRIAQYLNRMAVKAGDKIVLVSMSDVLWIQSHGNLICLHLLNASYEHRVTIKDICRRLDPAHFLRVHRSVVVNLDHVVEFDLPRRGNAFVHLRNGKALPISGAARLTVRRELLSQSYASADDHQL
jgi:DNA-binding LytR/AlgR family response regulator